MHTSWRANNFRFQVSRSTLDFRVIKECHLIYSIYLITLHAFLSRKQFWHTFSGRIIMNRRVFTCSNRDTPHIADGNSESSLPGSVPTASGNKWNSITIRELSPNVTTLPGADDHITWNRSVIWTDVSLHCLNKLEISRYADLTPVSWERKIQFARLNFVIQT